MKNPFDTMVGFSVPPLKNPAGGQKNKPSPALARMEHAAETAENQRALAQKLRDEREQEKPKLKVKRATPQKTTPRARKDPSSHRVWALICLGFWAVISGFALSGGVGGVAVSLLMLPLVLLVIHLPGKLSLGGHTTGNGKAV